MSGAQGGSSNDTPKSKQTEASWAPTEADYAAANDHLKETAAGYRKEQGDWLKFFDTHHRDLANYGAGVHLYFGFKKGFYRLLWFTALLNAPYLVFNICGDALTKTVAFTSSEFPYDIIAKTTVANMGTWTDVDGHDERWVFDFRNITDLTLIVSAIDAFCVLLIYVVAVWYEKRVIPYMSKVHRKTEAFSLFVDHLPRQLKNGNQEYEAVLRKHFENLLRADLDASDARKVAPKLSVVRKSDKGCTPKRNCCGRHPGLDNRGRRLGYVVETKSRPDGCIDTVKVRWSKIPGEGSQTDAFTEDVAPGELYDCTMLHNLEFENAFTPDADLIYDVVLVRDFGGVLQPQVADSVEKGCYTPDEKEICCAFLRKELGTNPKMRAKIPMVERDVVGAFVTLNRTKHRNWLFEEYRFSRTLLAASQTQRQRFCGKKIRVWEAAEPSDIFWANMDHKKFGRFLRLALITLICLIFVAGSCVFFSAAEQASEYAAELSQNGSMVMGECVPYGQNRTTTFNGTTTTEYVGFTECQCAVAGITNVARDIPAGIKTDCDTWFGEQAWALSLGMIAAGSAPVMNVAIGFMNQFLVTFQRPISLTTMNRNLMQLTWPLQFINLVVITILVNADFKAKIWDLTGQGGFLGIFGNGKFSDLDPSWYCVAGATILFSLAITAVSGPAMALSPLPIYHVCRCLFKSGIKTREAFLKLYTYPLFAMALRYATDLSFIFACLVLSSGMPLLWILLPIYTQLCYWSDKYIFLRASARPPQYQHHLTLSFVWWLQVACLLHCGFAIFVFGNTEAAPSHGADAVFTMHHWGNSSLTYLKDKSEDIGVLGEIVERALLTSTMPQFIVIGIIILIILLRTIYFWMGRAASGAFLAATGCCRCCARIHHDTKKEEWNCGLPCCDAILRCLRCFSLWVGELIADFSTGLDASLLDKDFGQEPVQKFKESNIPYSYSLQDNEDYAYLYEGSGADEASSRRAAGGGVYTGDTERI